MPNWCSNHVTLSHDDSEKIDILVEEFQKPDDDQKPFQLLRPRPADQDENWYGWNCDNWGTKWDVNVFNYERIDDNTITFSFDSAWSPPIALYEFLESEGWLVKAYYHEPGMNFAGIYQDGFDEYYELASSAEELREQLPEDLDDFFGISSYAQDREEEETQIEQQEIEAEWEKTEWFSKKIKPVREGTYEIRTKAWPFPHKAVWDGESFKDPFFHTESKVKEWRGLTENQYMTLVLPELDDLLKQLDTSEEE
jgi:hypothetical protein